MLELLNTLVHIYILYSEYNGCEMIANFNANKIKTSSGACLIRSQCLKFNFQCTQHRWFLCNAKNVELNMITMLALSELALYVYLSLCQCVCCYCCCGMMMLLYLEDVQQFGRHNLMLENGYLSFASARALSPTRSPSLSPSLAQFSFVSTLSFYFRVSNLVLLHMFFSFFFFRLLFSELKHFEEYSKYCVENEFS